MVSGVPPVMVHPIDSCGDRFWLDYVHLHQVLFNVFWPWSNILNEEYFILLSFNFTFQLGQYSYISLSDPPWVPAWNCYHINLLMFPWVLLVLSYFLPWLIITGLYVQICTWSKLLHCFILPHIAFHIYLIGPSSDYSKTFLQNVVHQYFTINIHACWVPWFILSFLPYPPISSIFLLE